MAVSSSLFASLSLFFEGGGDGFSIGFPVPVEVTSNQVAPEAAQCL